MIPYGASGANLPEKSCELGIRTRVFPPLFTIHFFHYTNHQLDTILHTLGI